MSLAVWTRLDDGRWQQHHLNEDGPVPIHVPTVVGDDDGGYGWRAPSGDPKQPLHAAPLGEADTLLGAIHDAEQALGCGERLTYDDGNVVHILAWYARRQCT